MSYLYRSNYSKFRSRNVKGKTSFVLMVGLCMTLFVGCSTRKNTPATRAYHELTTRYNVYFNAEETYNENLNALIENHNDNWHELLPMYPNSAQQQESVAKQPGGAFDAVIDKTTKAIGEHSISAKPRRDAARMGLQEYRDWVRQNEFNPFIHRAWLLMGKAHVQNRDYSDAVAVFSQTARLFSYDIDVVSEAQIWMMRAYTEMGWFSDAESLASTLQVRQLPKSLQDNFNEFYAFLFLREGKHRDAIPFLIQTIGKEKNPIQKRRLQFLLGQLYTNLGERENAYNAFDQIKGLSTPYSVTFNVLMAQAQVSAGSAEIIETLQKMAKSKKNEELLDQIFTAIGNIYLSQNNTDKAAENYSLAEKKSVRNGIDKALAQIALGDIYFARKEFVKAEPRYSQALGILPRTNVNYPRVEFRSNALRELVPHISAVAEQDSLQHLASLPQHEQRKIINAYIGELKKREREAERDAYLSEQVTTPVPTIGSQQPLAAESAVALANRSADAEFYFYSPQLVAQGKVEFRRRWGNRSLEDNWRLQNFTSSPGRQVSSSPSRPLAPSPGRPSDPYSVEFYLQQLPVSEESKAASDKIIENGLFEGGKVARERLEEFEFAAGLFERHLKDFPASEQRKDVYHQLYMLNLQIGNTAVAQSYKSKIISEFPDSDYAISMSDPDYERVMRNFAQAQDSLYQQTYQAYRQGKSEEVHRNFQTAKKLFSTGNLMPKFRLLHALAFAQTGDVENLQASLEELAEKHPESEEIKLGQNILSGLSEGKTLAVNASAVSGINRQIQQPEMAADTVQFNSDKNVEHSFLLIFSANAVPRNRLLFAVSDFNFSHFQIRAFTTAYIRVSAYEALQIRPFRSFDEARRYAQMVESDSVFLQNVPQGIVPLVISDENLKLLDTSKSLTEYMEFINDSVREIVPIKEQEALVEPEKTVPLEPEIIDKPISEPQQQAPKQAERQTIEQRLLELERKAEEALKQTDNVLSKRDREKIIKEREKARKELIKQRERELRQREKARKEELKQRERERRQKLKEQEQLRKEKQKERERILREK